ncbi:hypothetical protein NXG27_13155 [Megasphaera paucivorans]|uniref:Uncharacterized protein n=1 Tax=Megasphaera paucivorans TaxID=349095 RepID=A0A1G9Y764_9FIRM|nr:hypothetical protein [Megasphaera paucivorans]SDN04365.1 hypothetical protein SAMN05660299_01995 [Megasphaera paucivorans]
MENQFVNITTENLVHEHLCCIIRSTKLHPGIEAKRQWLSARLYEGMSLENYLQRLRFLLNMYRWKRLGYLLWGIHIIIYIVYGLSAVRIERKDTARL